MSRKMPNPDPWGAEVEEAIQADDAVPVCIRCFSPQLHDRWFCPECGSATGPYNNWLPYVYLFSIGEILRSGVDGRVRHSWLTITGYVLVSANSYMVFAPVYWYLLWADTKRPRPALPPELPDERF